RSPDVNFELRIPKEIKVKPENIFVNIIGRGEVLLADLEKQFIGRVGSNYSYNKVGSSKIESLTDGPSIIRLSGLDLRPNNGIDIQLRFKDVIIIKSGTYVFKSKYFI